jgi:uncharacterized DUF497 family protein
MAGFLYEFRWDPVKAKANFNKHGVEFDRATEVFRDPLTLTIPDEKHSETEVRWITLGRGTAVHYILVVQTFEQLTSELGRVRMISARRPIKVEMRDYKEER